MPESGIDAEELLARLRADPKWVAAKEQRDRELAQRQAAYREAQIPLIKDLNEVGVQVKSVWDLVNTRSPYPPAVPVLLKHLTLPYPERIREGIARALAVPEARSGWTTLLETFLHEKDTSTQGVTWGLALALGAAATDNELDEVLSLLRDKKFGANRIPLLKVLCRSRDPRAFETLNELKDDVDLSHEVKLALRRLKGRGPNRKLQRA